MTYRVGIVAYLNAKPLTWVIEQGEMPGLEPVLTVPSALARQLADGELDAAMLSSVVALQQPGMTLFPEAGCIAADGAVQSVLLFSRVHVDQIRSVALDASSVTSVALTRIILEQRYGVRPQYHTLPPDLPAMLEQADAALVIGDPGLSQYFRGDIDLAAYDVIDLGREWRDWTGLPFVFAAWIGPERLRETDLPERLAAARRASAQRIPAIARAEAQRLGLPEGVCRFYLEQVIRYEFGPREQQGFERFRACWQELAT